MFELASFCKPRLTTSRVFCHTVKISFYVRYGCQSTRTFYSIISLTRTVLGLVERNTHAMFQVVMRPLIKNCEKHYQKD